MYCPYCQQNVPSDLHHLTGVCSHFALHRQDLFRHVPPDTDTLHPPKHDIDVLQALGNYGVQGGLARLVWPGGDYPFREEPY